ncbi:MAG: hypothetical protein EBR82_01440 [Caulobacteraceae bacterium]|nr:hypothetical protein [Caulobacteraceae bacterium]
MPIGLPPPSPKVRASPSGMTTVSRPMRTTAEKAFFTSQFNMTSQAPDHLKTLIERPTVRGRRGVTAAASARRKGSPKEKVLARLSKGLSTKALRDQSDRERPADSRPVA